MSDWGRDSSRAVQSGSRGSPIAVVLLALMAIGAGGYIAWDKFIAADNGTILQAELERKNRQLDDIQQKLDQATSTARTGQASENAAAASLREELGQSRELIAELRAQLDNGNGDQIPRLESELADRDKALAENEKTITDLRDRIEIAGRVASDLENRLQLANDKDIPALKAEIAARDAQLQKMDAEISRLSKLDDELKSLQAAAGSNSADKDAAEKLVGKMQEKVSSLEKELDAARSATAAADARLRETETAATALNDALKTELATTKAEAEALRKEVAALSARDAEKSAGTAELKTRTLDNATATGLTPRDPLMVAAALGNTKGLEGMTSGQRDAVATGLIEGKCVAAVLAETFGRAPAIALRDLIRALESDC
ncbi:MAG: hypothetical protein R3D32_10085 [Nitratireductor sp.]